MLKSIPAHKWGILLLFMLQSACGQSHVSDVSPSEVLKRDADLTQNLNLFPENTLVPKGAPMVQIPAAKPLPDRPRIALADYDAFYSYADSAMLASVKNGTVLRTRTFPWTFTVLGISRTVSVVQLLYRTTDGQNNPATNVTSLIKSMVGEKRCVISYQSAYDSLNPLDSPSAVIKNVSNPSYVASTVDATDNTSATASDNLLQKEVPIIANLLSATGCNILIPDTEGQIAAFAHGIIEGRTTLDSVRAVLYKKPPTNFLERLEYLATITTSDAGLSIDGAVVVMVGYSGGAIATGWAASLASEYAPELLANTGILGRPTLVGASMGGLLIDPIRNLRYVTGSLRWGAVAPAALAGIARGYGIDLNTYLTAEGQALLPTITNQSLIAMPAYPAFIWTNYLAPNYQGAWQDYLAGNGTAGFGPLALKADELNLAAHPAPKMPIQLVQGAYGASQGTYPDCVSQIALGQQAFAACAAQHEYPSDPNFYGDGVMLAADARTLARNYCAAGTPVQFRQVDNDHTRALVSWGIMMAEFVVTRIPGLPIITNCGDIQPGSDLRQQYPTPH